MTRHRVPDRAPPSAARRRGRVPGDAPTVSAFDPVCGRPVSPHSPHHLAYRGRLYRFCSAGCQLAFQEAPERFRGVARVPLAAGTPPTGGEIGGEPVYAHQTPAQAAGRDPVCRMWVGAESPHRLKHRGETLWFCTERCLETFRAWPARYRGGKGTRHDKGEKP